MIRRLNKILQSHHHNGGQAVGRPHVTCSICGRRFPTLCFSVGAHSVARPWVPISPRLTHVVYLLPFLSHLADCKSVSARPPDPDTMTNTALETIASSSGNNAGRLGRRPTLDNSFMLNGTPQPVNIPGIDSSTIRYCV